MLQQHDSDWWNAESMLDILLEVAVDGPPPTIRWAKSWFMRQTFGMDER